MIKSLIAFSLFLISFSFTLSQDNLEEVTPDDLNRIIGERNGKLLLINVWATWCIPCREEFPDLVKLYDEYKEELDIVAISVDFKDEIENKVKPFLDENRVKFKVLMNGFNQDEDLITYFNNAWNGALPGTFIYDKNGNQIKFIEGKQSLDSFSSTIDYILGKSKL